MNTSPTVRCGDHVRTHDEVKVRAARLATALSELGVGHGDRYAIVMRNCVEFVEASMAGAAIGAVPVPVNWHWTRDDLHHLLSDSGSKVVIVHTDLLPGVESVLPTGVEVVEAGVPAAVAAAYLPVQPELTGRYPDLESLIDRSEPTTAPNTAPPLSVIYTSGTTGTPKGIVRQPVPPRDGQRLGQLMVEALAFGDSRSTLIPTPLYHSAPNTHAMFAVTLGLDLEIMPRFDPEGLLRLVADRRLEHIQMVPIMFSRLLKLPAEVRSDHDLSSLRSVVHAAAPCPPEIKRAMIGWFGPIIHEFYGGSETGPVVICSSGDWLEHPGTVGRPFADVEVRILDDGVEVATGETAEIYVRPPSAWPDFTYLDNEKKRRDMESDGFLSVGDIGRVDADGFVYLSDRRNDMVNSGGVNIYPAEIESCIHALPGIGDVAVFGIPDDEYGEALACHVELVDGATVDTDDIRDHVGRHLARYKIPKVIVIDDRLPREDTGKLFKRRVKEQYWTDRVDA
ncbi:AMP-binding protein [Gordonia rubripertincta]|uniref:AMP-binding protein n=1 Tax=Gordonia rubripertincta TaxID=36822 RepID=A0AAW4FZF7_GORRU|nr:AMP-binding protein [Gordonia rubripertincta]MBM7276365.1 AMP-binding protein [Gordonia rubripertincta]